MSKNITDVVTVHYRLKELAQLEKLKATVSKSKDIGFKVDGNALNVDYDLRKLLKEAAVNHIDTKIAAYHAELDRYGYSDIDPTSLLNCFPHLKDHTL